MTADPATGAGRAGAGAAVDRVTRTMSLGLGVATLVFAVLAIDRILGHATIAHPLWTVGAVSTVVVAPVIAAAVSRFAPLAVLRALAGTTAVGYLLALALIIPALPGGILPDGVGSTWLFSFSVVGASAAAVASRPALTWPYVVVIVVLHGIVRTESHVTRYVDLGVQEAVHTLLFDSVFVALAFATVRAGRLLDAAADEAVRESRSAAAAEARGRERARVDALIHDSVLVALLASARGRPRAAESARHALDRLTEADGDRGDAPVSGREWMWRLQALATDISPSARFLHETDESATVPADVADAAIESAAEALRNSERHAGDAARAVYARVGAGGLEVSVLDDGRGFRPREVGPARLGIAIGIRGRMRSLPGGDAVIASEPGKGTRVRISWSSP
jgi:signal transduction histidine kinase